MKPILAISWLRAANRHFAASERYRWWPLYAAGVAAVMHITWQFPWDISVVNAYRIHHWLFEFNQITWYAGITLCIVLGAIGLLRPNWVARGLSLYALWFAQLNLRPYYWEPAEWLRTKFLWYTFDLPANLIHGLTGEGTAAATCLWLVYWALVWVLVRPFAKRAWWKVRQLHDWVIDRWPVLERFDRPVM